MESKKITDQEFLEKSWRELLYDPKDDYYGCSKFFSHPYSAELGLVSPKWFLEASWDQIRNYKPPSYYRNRGKDLEIFKSINFENLKLERK